MESIIGLLDDFKNKYNKRVFIEEDNLDVTECFFSKNLSSFKAPKSFGNLNENKVILYVVYGAPFVEKYKREIDGKLVYEEGKFMPVAIENDYKVLACLCLKETKNVSLHEIYDAIHPNNKIEVQGVRRWVLRNIINKIKNKYPNFDETKDTAFIFAGKKELILQKIELNKLWLKQFLNIGSKSLEFIENGEKELIKKIFIHSLKNPKDSVYKFRDITIHETAEFIKRKIDLVS